MKKFLSIFAIIFTFAPIFYFLFKPAPVPEKTSLQQGYYNLVGRYVGIEKPKLHGIYSLVQGGKAKKVIIPPPEINP